MFLSPQSSCSPYLKKKKKYNLGITVLFKVPQGQNWSHRYDFFPSTCILKGKLSTGVQNSKGANPNAQSKPDSHPSVSRRENGFKYTASQEEELKCENCILPSKEGRSHWNLTHDLSASFQINAAVKEDCIIYSHPVPLKLLAPHCHSELPGSRWGWLTCFGRTKQSTSGTCFMTLLGMSYCYECASSIGSMLICFPEDVVPVYSSRLKDSHKWVIAIGKLIIF